MRAPAWCTASSSGSAPRRRSTSGRSGCAARASTSRALDGRLTFAIPRASASSSRSWRRATSRSSRSTRRSRPSTRSRASTACAPTPSTRSEPRVPRGRARVRARTTSDFEARGEQRGGFYVYDRTASAGIPGAGHRPPRGLGVDAGGARGVAAARDRRPAAGRPRHRPLLLQVDLLPRAERRPVRDRDDGPGLHDRRAAGDPRRAPLAAARLRAPPRAGRAGADAAPEPAGRAGRRTEPRLRGRDRPRASRKARSSSSTAAARTSTISFRCSTRSTRSAGCSA